MLLRQLKYDRRYSENKQTYKIADKCSAGWKTVQEYLSDDLASDSEDDKKLKAEEARVLRPRLDETRNELKPV